jgi:hypothetical protein
MKTYFYYLKHPVTGEVRYIGQSKNPKQRQRQHVNAVKSGKDKNTRKSNWIKFLLKDNLIPDLEVFETYLGDPAGAHKREWQLITEHLDKGFRLVNGNDGGSPYLLPDDRVKKVYQYNMVTLEKLAEYRCAFDAGIHTGLRDGNIIKSAKSISKYSVQFCGGFLWSYEDYPVFPKEKLVFSNRHNKKPVLATNLATGESIKYASAREAATLLNLSYRNISAVCLGDKKTHKGFMFSFV